MGGQRLLVNPNLEASTDLTPENVHRHVDYVVITSAQEEFFHAPTIKRMNLAKVNFIASGSAGRALSRLLVQNVAILEPGPGGRVMLAGEKGATPVMLMVTPGSSGRMPWDPMESGFIFINLETGVAVAYEALGQFLGPGAATTRDGIPEEAYQVDYLVTPNLREAAGVVKGLTAKGAVLRGVVALPNPMTRSSTAPGDPSPLLAPLIALDRSMDSALGGVGDDPAEFRDFLKKQGKPLAQTQLFEVQAGTEALGLE